MTTDEEAGMVVDVASTYLIALMGFIPTAIRVQLCSGRFQ